MSFFNQVIDLLSQSPGSLIYHFGILFAIEATLGITLGHRDRPAIRRLAVVAGAMLVLRLGLMVVALLDYSQVIANPAAILPPLERAVDATSVWLLIWALLPLFGKMPQWGDLLAGAGSLLLVVLYLFFAVAWYTDVSGMTAAPAYNGSYQDALWETIQLGLLGAALVTVLATRTGDWGLHFGMLLVLFGGHLAHYGWGPTTGNVAGWVRLGQLVAYPLLTVAAYRSVIGRLVEETARIPPGPLLIAPLDQMRQVASVTGLNDETALVKTAVATVARLAGADAVALLQLVGDPDSRIELEKVAVYSDGQALLADRSKFAVDDAPALRRVINNEQALFLRPDGPDDLSRLSILVQLLPEVALEDRLDAFLLVQPVNEEKTLFGVLLIAFAQASQVSDDRLGPKRQLVDLLSLQLARALSQARMLRRLQEQAARTTAQLQAVDGTVSDRLTKLQAELFETRRSERELARQLDKTQEELQQAQKRSQDLAALVEGRSVAEALAGVDELDESQQARILDLQEQLDTLALELDSGEFVSQKQIRSARAVTRPLSFLRTDRPAERGPADNLVQELRQPIASIVGYTDLLLGESIGTVGDLQRVFLERVKASSERARVLLDDLVQVIQPADEPLLLDLEPVRLEELVQSAIEGFSKQAAEKEVDLQVYLAESLPMVEVDRDVLDQILYHLLLNALRVTPSGEQVSVEVRYQDADAVAADGDDRLQGYVFMSVRDSGGGIPLADQARVFDRQSRTNDADIPGLRDAGMGLPLVSELAKAHGGRVWLESEPEAGSTFSVVLPVSVVSGTG
jgi:signal transduction histidine kinase